MPGRRKYWDNECRESKKKMNRTLRLVNKGTLDRKFYAREKLRHKKLCKEKEEEKREREQKRIMSITDQNEIWRYIRRDKGGRERLGKGIEPEVWRKYFMTLLEGKEKQESRRKEKEEERTVNGENIVGEVQVGRRKLQEQ